MAGEDTVATDCEMDKIFDLNTGEENLERALALAQETLENLRTEFNAAIKSFQELKGAEKIKKGYEKLEILKDKIEFSEAEVKKLQLTLKKVREQSLNLVQRISTIVQPGKSLPQSPRA